MRPCRQKELAHSEETSLPIIKVTVDLTEAATLRDSSVSGYLSMAGRFPRLTPGATCNKPLVKQI